MQVEFIASLADTASAIKIGSDGMKIQLDIPENQMPEAQGLIDMRRRALFVTISLSDTPPPAAEGQGK